MGLASLETVTGAGAGAELELALGCWFSGVKQKTGDKVGIGVSTEECDFADVWVFKTGEAAEETLELNAMREGLDMVTI